MRRWHAVDWLVAGYATFVAVLAIVCAVPQAPALVVAHAVLVAGIWWLPPRGAAWESRRPADSRGRARARAIARFLRYTYPALLLTPFFEEVTLTVNAVRPEDPYWFERYLIGADRALFGGTPAAMLSHDGNAVLDELLHGFYLSYYFLITAGIVLAWRGPKRGQPTPGTGFHTVFTTMMLGFLLSFVWYPFLPARGPWELPELVAGLRPLEGWLFTPAIELIIAGAAVSGGCFPSAHVSGTWALTFGLYRYQPRAARWFAVLALGLSLACVYTRYHHALDVVTGVAVAAVAAWLPGRECIKLSAYSLARSLSLSLKDQLMASTTGTIKRMTDKGFGFIAAPDGTEYFFHQSACTSVPFNSMREGQSVTFTVGQGPKGPRAENVKPA